MGLWNKEGRYCASYYQIEPEEEGMKNCAFTPIFMCMNAHKYGQALNASLTNT